MIEYFSIDDFNLKGKVVGVRVDINSPIVDGEVVLNDRIVEHSKTIKKLSKLGARVVILAHQGRYGNSDCVSLKAHRDLLEKTLKKQVNFVPEIYSYNVEQIIFSMKDSEILLLENLRFSFDETNYDSKKKNDNEILKLEKIFDYYVFDAFSVSHRVQSSVVGFDKIPVIAGCVMENELIGLKNILTTKKPSVYLFGGAKPDDLVDILDSHLKSNKVDKVLLSGVIGEVALMCSGYNLGLKEDFLEKKDFLGSKSKISKLIKKYKDRIIIPSDVTIVDNTGKRVEILVSELNEEKNQELVTEFLIKDIGSQTVRDFDKIIKSSGSVYFKGPAGDFEDKKFSDGTRGLVESLSKTDAFTYLGGGHSVTAINQFSNKNKFNYMSLAGGALVKFLSGKVLPGVEILEETTKKFRRERKDFLVVGSNTIDIEVDVPTSLKNFHLGDKIKIDEDFDTGVGGGGVNVSICLARLGSDVGYLGKMSTQSIDEISEKLNSEMVKIVDSKVTEKSAAKSILIDTTDSDRVILTHRGQNQDLDIRDFKMSDIFADKFYFSSLGGKSFKTICELSKKIKVRKNDSLICFNLSQHLIQTEKRLKSMLKYVDIVILNFDEAKLLTKKKKVTECLHSIFKMVRQLVVITDGSHGSYCYDGEKEYFVKAVKDKVVDATGAGDCFAGTFFYFYSKGYDISSAMTYASYNAINVCKYKGAQRGLLKYDELIKVVGKNSFSKKTKNKK